MIRPVDALLDFLRAQQARGVTHIHLDPDTRQELRSLNEQIRSGTCATAPSPKSSQATPSAPPQKQTAAAPALPPTPAAAAAEIPHQLAGGSLKEKLASLEKIAESWAPARALGTLRDTMVFATGNPNSNLMLIGEAPGYEEERKGEPFVGPAGQKLDQILRAMGILRTQVYISNIVKFRPATQRQTTNNRAPTKEEILACLPIITREIELIEPSCIIALGGTAATGLLATTANVTSLRGTWHEFNGIPVRVTYHPSYLLRSTDDLRTKRMVWEDMLAVMDLLGMPVSDKQRTFFLPPT